MRIARYPLAAFSLLCLFVFALSIWPISYHSEKGIIVSAPDLALTVTIDLTYPEKIRLGTSVPLHLVTRLAADSSHLQPTLTIVSAESACLNVDPNGSLIQEASFAQAQPWVWQLASTDTLGQCNLDVLLRLQVGDGERLVWVRKLSIETVTVLGLPAPIAQALGLVGSVLGLLMLTAIQIHFARLPKSLLRFQKPRY